MNNSFTVNGRPVKTAAQLEAELLGLGFAPGVPQHITVETAALDRRITRRSRCPHCRKGRDYRPFGRARDRRYKVVAVCATCGHAEEM